MGSTRQKPGRRRKLRGLQMGGFVAVLLLLVVAPVALAAVTSTTTYLNFAPNGEQGDNHWRNSNQTVSILVSPNADKIATAHFSSDNGSSYTQQTYPIVGTAGFDFVVSAEGSNPIKFYATDSTPETQTAYPPSSPGYVNIDKTDPVTGPTGLAPVSTQSTEAAWSKDTTRSVTLAAADPLPTGVTAVSGVRFNVRRINSGSVVTSSTASVTFTLVKGSGGVVEGANAVTFSAIDWAGNVETTQTGYVNIDTLAPTTTASPALATSATTGWRNASTTVTFGWTDASSGVPTGGTSYRLNDGNPTVYVSPFTVSAEGSTKVTYRSIDRALNAEATQTAYVNIDETSPTVSAATAPKGSSGWYNKDAVVTLTGADALSGVAKTQYRLQGAASWTDAAGNQFTVPVSPSAKLTYDYQAVDNAGNVSAPASLKLTMDSVKPQAYGQNKRGKVGESIKLRYRFSDDLSPKVKSVYVKITKRNGDVVKTVNISGQKAVKTWYRFTWKPTAKGTYKYYVHGTDLAGNTSKTTPSTITVK